MFPLEQTSISRTIDLALIIFNHNGHRFLLTVLAVSELDGHAQNRTRFFTLVGRSCAARGTETALWEAYAPLWSDGRALGKCARHGHQGTTTGSWEGVIR
jgi:hypothetical protein